MKFTTASKKVEKTMILLVICIVLISCDKDDQDSSANKNFLKVDDIEYDLSAGIIENYGIDVGNNWHFGYNTDLLLYSKNLSFQMDEDEWELIGNGQAVYFEMFSTTALSLDNTDYLYTSSEPCQIGTFDDADYIINYESDDESELDSQGIANGSVKVSKSGSTYSITINCTSKNGKNVTGFYKGALHYVDSSEEYNSSASLKNDK